ncbi:MAG: hypothetical protein R2752_09180 [Vicinamibacterales bacterium]
MTWRGTGLSFLLIGLVALPAPARAQTPTVTSQSTAGLRVVTMTQPAGRVTVFLPDDLAPGERVSGTIRLAPAGTDAAAREANLATLRAQTVRIGNGTVAAADGRFSTTLPAAGGLDVGVEGAGLSPAATRLQTAAAPPSPAGYRLPDVAESRVPLRVEGRFDGDLDSTRVTVGGRPASVLAESPRGVIAQVPAGVTGPTTLSVTDPGVALAGPMRAISLTLSAPTTTLRRGEQTVVTATVAGLQGLDQPLQLSLTVGTTNVSMQGGNRQQIAIAPSAVDGGQFRVSRALTASVEGGFNVTATLPVAGQPSRPADNTAATESAPPAAPPATPATTPPAAPPATPPSSPATPPASANPSTPASTNPPAPANPGPPTEPPGGTPATTSPGATSPANAPAAADSETPTAPSASPDVVTSPDPISPGGASLDTARMTPVEALTAPSGIPPAAGALALAAAIIGLLAAGTQLVGQTPQQPSVGQEPQQQLQDEPQETQQQQQEDTSGDDEGDEIDFQAIDDIVNAPDEDEGYGPIPEQPGWASGGDRAHTTTPDDTASGTGAPERTGQSDQTSETGRTGPASQAKDTTPAGQTSRADEAGEEEPDEEIKEIFAGLDEIEKAYDEEEEDDGYGPPPDAKDWLKEWQDGTSEDADDEEPDEDLRDVFADLDEIEKKYDEQYEDDEDDGYGPLPDQPKLTPEPGNDGTGGGASDGGTSDDERDDGADLPVVAGGEPEDPAQPAAKPQEQPSAPPNEKPLDQPLSHDELQEKVDGLDQASKDFKDAIDAYNAVNEELNRARPPLDWANARLGDLRELLNYWDPKKAPPKREHGHSRVIIRTGEPGHLDRPIADDVTDVETYSRRMTRREVEEEFRRLSEEVARIQRDFDRIQARWDKAWETLKQKGLIVASRWAEVQAALRGNELLTTPVREWSTPGVGGFTVDGNRRVSTCWLPPTITLPDPPKPEPPAGQGPGDGPGQAGSGWDQFFGPMPHTCGGSAMPPWTLFKPEDARPARGGVLVRDGSRPAGTVADGDDTPAGTTTDTAGAADGADSTDTTGSTEAGPDISGYNDVDWASLDEYEAEWDARYAQEDAETDDEGYGALPSADDMNVKDPFAGLDLSDDEDDEREVFGPPPPPAAGAPSAATDGGATTPAAPPAATPAAASGAPSQTLSAEDREAVERIVSWAMGVPGVESREHPLVLTLLGLAGQIGLSRVLPLIANMSVGGPQYAIEAVLDRLADGTKDPQEAIAARQILVQLFDALIASADRRRLWNVDAGDLVRLRDRALSDLVDEALRAGTPDALVTGLAALARPADQGGRPDDPRAARLRELLETQLRAYPAQSMVELAEVATGQASLDRLRTIAKGALETGRLDVFVAASLNAIRRGNDPFARQVAQVLGIADLLRAIADGRIGAPKAPAGTTTTPEATVLADAALANVRRQARELLGTIGGDVERMFGQHAQDALDLAMEEAGAAGLALETAIVAEADEADIKRLRDALDAKVGEVRDAARLRLMLQTVAVDPAGRLQALRGLRDQAQQALDDYESRLSRFAEDTRSRGRASGRRQALRAARDAAEDLMLPLDPELGQKILDRIYEELNGTWHQSPYGARATFRENGVRQRLDAAYQADDDSSETRGLIDDVSYLEQRRLRVIFQTKPSWEAADEYRRIKHGEEQYWKSQQRWEELRWLGQTTADRVIADVGQYRSRELPYVLSELGRMLDDPQGFIRYIAKLRVEDVEQGAEAWAAYYATSWHKRGLVVQSWRFLRVRQIQDEMLADRTFAEALRAAGDIPAARLKQIQRWAYDLLEQKGFIRNGAYVVPEDFTYSPETTGSQMSQRHWSDDLLNVESIINIVATVLVPGGAAARLTTGLAEAYQVSQGLRSVVPLARLALAQGALFTAFSTAAHGALHGLNFGTITQGDASGIAKEFAINTLAIGGASLLNRVAQPLEEKLIGEIAMRQALSAPVGSLSRAQLRTLLAKTIFESGKIGVEAGGFTFLGAAPGLGHGPLSAQSFWHNVLFMLEIRLAGLGGSIGGPRLDRPGGARPGRPAEPKVERSAEPKVERPAARPETGDILEPGRDGRPVAGPEFSRRFLEWYGSALRQLGIKGSGSLRGRLVDELGRIIRDPDTPGPKRESARTLRLLLKGKLVDITFENEGPSIGGYNPKTGRATIYVAEIAKSLFVRMARRGRTPTAQEWLDGVLGTTVHEAMVHGLQGFDLPRGTDRPAEPGETRPYSPLHEVEAYAEQRQFDPTLNGRDPKGAARTDAEALEVIFRLVADNAHYQRGKVDRRNLATLRDLNPEAYRAWKAATAGGRGRGRLTLEDLFARQVYEAGDAVARAVRRAVERLRRSREAADDARGLAEQGDGPMTTPADQAAAVKFLRALGIDAPDRGALTPPQQKALIEKMIAGFRTIESRLEGVIDRLGRRGRSTEKPEAARAAAEATRELLEANLARIREYEQDRTRSHDPARDPVLFRFQLALSDVNGRYRMNEHTAYVFLAAAARSAEAVARRLYGRPATAREFLLAAMGTSVHEGLAHGVHQHAGGANADLGLRPYRLAQELEAFLIQSLIHPEGRRGLADLKTEQERRAFVEDLVTRLYSPEKVLAVNAEVLGQIDAPLAETWREARTALEEFAGDRDSAARRRLTEILGRLPLGEGTRADIARFLDPPARSAPDATPADPTVPRLPVPSLRVLQALIVEDLLLTRVERGAGDRLRQSAEHLRRIRNGEAPPRLPRRARRAPRRLSGGIDIDARMDRLTDWVGRLFGRTPADPPADAAAPANPLEGIPPEVVRQWRSTLQSFENRDTFEQALTRLASLARQARDLGLAGASIDRIFRHLATQHPRLVPAAEEALPRLLLLADAMASGLTVVVDPRDGDEFDRFRYGMHVRTIDLPLSRFSEIVSRVYVQLREGRPQLTANDLAFLETSIFPLGRDRARRLYSFERAASDEDRTQLRRLLPDELLEALTQLYANGRPPVVDPPPPPVSPAMAAIGADLHAWRHAVRGHDAGERQLLRVLRRAHVGRADVGLTVAGEIDARLGAVPRGGAAGPFTGEIRQPVEAIRRLLADAIAIARRRPDAALTSHQVALLHQAAELLAARGGPDHRAAVRSLVELMQRGAWPDFWPAFVRVRRELLAALLEGGVS